MLVYSIYSEFQASQHAPCSETPVFKNKFYIQKREVNLQKQEADHCFSDARTGGDEVKQILENKTLYLDYNSHLAGAGGSCMYQNYELCSFNGYTVLHINSISIKLKTKIIHAIILNFLWLLKYVVCSQASRLILWFSFLQVMPYNLMLIVFPSSSSELALPLLKAMACRVRAMAALAED